MKQTGGLRELNGAPQGFESGREDQRLLKLQTQTQNANSHYDSLFKNEGN
jgi:hypothetical protein